MNDLQATRNFNIKRGRAIFAGAHDLVFRFDDAIAIGIHIEIEVVTADFIDDALGLRAGIFGFSI
jgi:hypothetical protein